MPVVISLPRIPGAQNVWTTPGVLTQIVLPEGITIYNVSIYARGEAFFTYTGVDGEPVGDNVEIPLLINTWLPLDALGSRTLFLGSSEPEPVATVWHFAQVRQGTVE